MREYTVTIKVDEKTLKAFKALIYGQGKKIGHAIGELIAQAVKQK